MNSSGPPTMPPPALPPSAADEKAVTLTARVFEIPVHPEGPRLPA